MRDLECRHQVDDLRGVEQATESDHLVRQARVAQGVDDRTELCPGPAQHRGGEPFALGARFVRFVPLLAQVVDDDARLLLEIRGVLRPDHRERLG